MGTQHVQGLAKGQWGQVKSLRKRVGAKTEKDYFLHSARRQTVINRTCNMPLQPDLMGWIETIAEKHKGGELQR